MRQAEQGFLLLCSHLGDPMRKPLTTAQFRTLAKCVRSTEQPSEVRELTVEDLMKLGYRREMGAHIIKLLSDRELLEYYLHKAKQQDCVPITRLDPAYPAKLRQRLGLDSPACLWAKGDITLLQRKAVSLVGSRTVQRENQEFARQVGIEAASQGFALVSGNARGADLTAQQACIAAGGSVISIVADTLTHQPVRENMLYLSEDGFDMEFSPFRALSRNRVIHCLGDCVFVAQSELKTGGTWDGTCQNLRHGWSNVFCFTDGSEAMTELTRMGAVGIGEEALADMTKLCQTPGNLFDQ